MGRSHKAPPFSLLCYTYTQLLNYSTTYIMSQEEQATSNIMMTEREFLLQVSTLRQELEGQTVVAYGGSWTAEAREPNRKQQLHDQLRLSRQLRAKLEQAVEIAEAARTQDERIEIMKQHTNQVNMLVSLTQAAQGGYTLDDYNEYTRYLKKKETDAEEVIKGDRETIVNQLIAMAEERKGPIAQPSVLEAVTTNPAAAVARRPPPVPAAASKPTTSTSTKSSSGDDESFRKRRASDSAQSAHSSDEEYTPGVVGSNSDGGGATTTGQQQSHPAAPRRRGTSAKRRKQRRTVAPRRCHDCKSSSTYFKKCHYWFLTGKLCSKTFCSRCLIFKYGCTDEEGEGWEPNDPDWQ